MPPPPLHHCYHHCPRHLDLLLRNGPGMCTSTKFDLKVFNAFCEIFFFKSPSLSGIQTPIREWEFVPEYWANICPFICPFVRPSPWDHCGVCIIHIIIVQVKWIFCHFWCNDYLIEPHKCSHLLLIPTYLWISMLVLSPYLRMYLILIPTM